MILDPVFPSLWLSLSWPPSVCGTIHGIQQSTLRVSSLPELQPTSCSSGFQRDAGQSSHSLISAVLTRLCWCLCPPIPLLWLCPLAFFVFIHDRALSGVPLCTSSVISVSVDFDLPSFPLTQWLPGAARGNPSANKSISSCCCCTLRQRSSCTTGLCAADPFLLPSTPFLVSGRWLSLYIHFLGLSEESAANGWFQQHPFLEMRSLKSECWRKLVPSTSCERRISP